jgi:hypothetical protein
MLEWHKNMQDRTLLSPRNVTMRLKEMQKLQCVEALP